MFTHLISPYLLRLNLRQALRCAMLHLVITRQDLNHLCPVMPTRAHNFVLHVRLDTCIIWPNQLWGVCAFWAWGQKFSVHLWKLKKVSAIKRQVIAEQLFILAVIAVAVLYCSTFKLHFDKEVHCITLKISPVVVKHAFSMCLALSQGNHEPPICWYLWMISIYT